jgi:hypothetical protein
MNISSRRIIIRLKYIEYNVKGLLSLVVHLRAWRRWDNCFYKTIGCLHRCTHTTGVLLDKCVAVATVFKVFSSSERPPWEPKLSYRVRVIWCSISLLNEDLLFSLLIKVEAFYPPCSMLVVRDGVESMQGTMMFWSWHLCACEWMCII